MALKTGLPARRQTGLPADVKARAQADRPACRCEGPRAGWQVRRLRFAILQT